MYLCIRILSPCKMKRISNLSKSRILSKLISLCSGLVPAVAMATILTVNSYLDDEEPQMVPGYDTEIYQLIASEIERAAIRSEKARVRNAASAEKRKLRDPEFLAKLDEQCLELANGKPFYQLYKLQPGQRAEMLEEFNRGRMKNFALVDYVRGRLVRL